MECCFWPAYKRHYENVIKKIKEDSESKDNKVFFACFEKAVDFYFYDDELYKKAKELDRDKFTKTINKIYISGCFTLHNLVNITFFYVTLLKKHGDVFLPPKLMNNKKYYTEFKRFFKSDRILDVFYSIFKDESLSVFGFEICKNKKDEVYWKRTHIKN